MDKETKKEFGNLAIMVKSGFEEVHNKLKEHDKTFDNVGRKLTSIDGRMEHMDALLSSIEKDISEIKGNFIYRYEFDDLMTRVKYLEKRLKIKSGK